MNSFSEDEENTTNNYDEDISFEYKEEPKDIILFLRKNLLKHNKYNIYANWILDNKYFMEAKEDKAKNSNDYITEDYFKNHEEIDEVKMNLFFILSKNFRLDYETYKDFIDNENMIKIQRLTLQKFSKLENNSINFSEKEYSFISIKKNKAIFPYGEDKIEVTKNNMKYNNEELFNEEAFLDKFNFLIIIHKL